MSFRVKVRKESDISTNLKMSPNTDSKNLTKLNELSKDPKESLKKPFKVQIVWRNIFLMTILHSSAVYGLYLYSAKAQFKTIIAVVVFKVLSGN